MKSLIPGVLLLAACSSAPSADSVRARASAAVSVDELKPTFRNFSFYGDYCPPGSYATSVSPDGEAFTISFANATEGSEACVVVIDMDMPAGYQMGNPSLILRPFGVNASLWRSYSYEGSFDARAFTSDVSDNTVLVDRPEGLWSPSCRGSNRVSLVAAFRPTVQPEGLFQLDSFDADVSYRGGTDWRRCGDAQPLQAPPGTVGQYCGGAHHRACAQGLACEFDGVGAAAGVEGSCVDPNEQVAPGGKGELCGGVRHIACQAGLVCWFPAQASADNGWLGRCEPAVGGEGDLCDEGVPMPACGAGLSCAHANPGQGDNRCVPQK